MYSGTQYKSNGSKSHGSGFTGYYKHDTTFKPFIILIDTEEAGVSNNDQFILPTTGSGYNFSVDWGDGGLQSIFVGSPGNITKTYSSPGVYEIKIYGTFPRINFEDDNDKLKLLEIRQWGDIEWSSMEGAFYGCGNMDMVATDKPNLSNVTSIGLIFAGCTSLVGNSSISSWNVNNVQVFIGVFLSCELFNIDITSWDVDNGIDFTVMLGQAIIFNQNLSSWNIQNMNNAIFMFAASAMTPQNYTDTLVTWFNQRFLAGSPNGVNFSGQTGMTYLNCRNGGANFIDAKDARADAVTNGLWSISDSVEDDCFRILIDTEESGTSANNQFTIPTLGVGYDYEILTSEEHLFNQTGDVTLEWSNPGIYEVRIRGNFPRIYFNNGGDRLKLLEIRSWGNLGWTSMESAFYGCSNMNMTATNVPNLSAAISIGNIFRGCSSLIGNSSFNSWQVDTITTATAAFSGAVLFNQNIGSWNTINFAFTNAMFFGASAFNQNISSWNMSNNTNISEMFFLATAFNQNLASWNISSIVTAWSIFRASGMSTANYTSTIVGWANFVFTNSNLPANIDMAQQTGRTYDTALSGGANFANAGAARTYLTTVPVSWTIANDTVI